MQFCDDCGSYLIKKGSKYWCPKCRKSLEVTQSQVEQRSIPRKPISNKRSDTIYFSEGREHRSIKVKRSCPKCGNEEAIRWLSSISGEHAGISRERTVEHFRCTRCNHSWSMSL